MGFFAGSYTKKTYTIAQLSGLTAADHIGRTYFVSDLNALAFTDGTSWFYTSPINALDQNNASRAMTAGAAKTLSENTAVVEAKFRPTAQKSYILSFASREAFIAAVTGTPAIGAFVAANYDVVRFERYYTAGPNIALEYRVVSSIPSEYSTDPTNITLVSGTSFLIQKYGETAHLHQFGFKLDDTNEGALFNTVAALSTFKTIECPGNATLASTIRLILPNDKALVCRNMRFTLKALADSTEAVATDRYLIRAGSRTRLVNIVAECNNFTVGGFQVTGADDVVLEKCSTFNAVKGNSTASTAGRFGFRINASTNVTLVSPTVYRAYGGIEVLGSSDVTIQRPTIDVVVHGCLIGDPATGDATNKRVHVENGLIRNCSLLGALIGGGEDNLVLKTNISRCGGGEMAFQTSGVTNGTKECRFDACVVLRDDSFTQLDGSSVIADATRGAISILGIDSGSRGSGVYHSTFRVRAGLCWVHLEAGTSGALSTDRSVTIENCTFNQENAGQPFRIATTAHSLYLVNNTFRFQQVLSDGDIRNIVRCHIVGNRFTSILPPSATILAVTKTTTGGGNYITDNVFTNADRYAMSINMAAASEVHLASNVLSSAPVAFGSLRIIGNNPPRYHNQQILAGTVRSNSGTTETIDLYTANDLGNLFVGGGTEWLGPGASIRLTMRVSGTNTMNSYDIQVMGGGAASNSYLLYIPTVGSGTGLSQSTALYISAFGAAGATGLTMTITKPSNAVLILSLTAKLNSPRF